MIEIWKDVPSYEGLYLVSNFGRVKRKNGNLLSPEDNKGYKRVQLYKDGKKTHIFVHRLVGMAFIPNPNNYPQINHKDENPFNNNVDNLEWCTAKYNCNYGHRNDTTSTPVKCIETGEIFSSAKKAQEQYKLGHHVLECCLGTRKTCGGFHWEFYKVLEAIA